MTGTHEPMNCGSWGGAQGMRKGAAVSSGGLRTAPLRGLHVRQAFPVGQACGSAPGGLPGCRERVKKQG